MFWIENVRRGWFPIVSIPEHSREQESKQQRSGNKPSRPRRKGDSNNPRDHSRGTTASAEDSKFLFEFAWLCTKDAHPPARRFTALAWMALFSRTHSYARFIDLCFSAGAFGLILGMSVTTSSKDRGVSK
jgi:hypothetical protein